MPTMLYRITRERIDTIEDFVDTWKRDDEPGTLVTDAQEFVREALEALAFLRRFWRDVWGRFEQGTLDDLEDAGNRPKPVPKRIGDFQLSRTLLARLLTEIHARLPHVTDQERTKRDPNDRDLFPYRIDVPEAGSLHTFTLSVNDTQATDHLFIES